MFLASCAGAETLGGISGNGYLIDSTLNTVSTYTVVTTTYPINVSAVLSPPDVTTVSWTSRGAQPVTSTYTVVTDTYSLPVAITGSIANTGFNVNNTPAVTQSGGPWTVIQSTSGSSASTMTVVVNNFPATQNTYTTNLTTVTHNNVGQPVTSTYTYVVNPSTVIFNGAQPITSTSVYIVNPSTVSWNSLGAQNIVSTSVYVVNLTTVTSNGLAIPTTSTSTYIVNPATVTFNGAQPVVSTSAVAAALVSSITIPGPLTDATTGSMLIDSIRRQIIADLPPEVILTTNSINISAATTEIVLISSASSLQRTALCGCVFKSTQVATGFTIYQSTSANSGNRFFPVVVSSITAGGMNSPIARADCGHPFFWSAQGGALTIKPDTVVAGNSYMNCTYIQK